MNKKELFLIVLVLLLTGCKANYILKYENGEFSEHLEIVSDEDNYQEDEAHPTYDNLKKNDTSAVKDGSEKWIVDKDSTMYDIKISHNLNKTTLDDLSIVYECFSKHTYKEDDNSIYYYAFGDYTCDYLDEDSSFILETKTKVVESNANDKSVDKYIWNLNSKEVKENGIYFQIMKENKTKKKDSSLIPWYIKLVLSIIVVVSVIGSITYIKNHS